MKSHKWAGQIKMNGKKTKLLSCGCCNIVNLPWKHKNKFEQIYLKEGLKELKDEQMNKKQNLGWICPKCGTPNAPTNETCSACVVSHVDTTGRILSKDQLPENKNSDGVPVYLTEDN